MDVTEFDVEDVITASGVNLGGGGSITPYELSVYFN